MTFVVWIVGTGICAITYALGVKDHFMDYILAVWTVFWVGFAVARIISLAWKEFIREQNQLFERLKENHE